MRGRRRALSAWGMLALVLVLVPRWSEAIPRCTPRGSPYFRAHQPPALVMWGKNDYIFPVEGARPYARDLQTIETHLLDTGHCALEEDGALIAQHMRRFLIKHVRPTNK